MIFLFYGDKATALSCNLRPLFGGYARFDILTY
jgi:hypothetical protein